MSERRRWEIWVLPAILAFAAVHYLWRLGTSSYYVDEALSIEHALPPLGQITEVVRATETTPSTYFLGLNQWLYHGGSQQEFDARLPSVLAGIALVAAVYWMARAFVDRRPALVAAGLCALSPFMLEYAQQVRAYVWMMLAVSLAVGATVRGGRWLWLGGTAAVAALALHYMAGFVIVPLCVWLLLQRDVSRWARAGYVAACLAVEAVLAPLFIDQYRAAPNGGELADAELGASSIVRLVSTPFDGRWTAGVDWQRIAGLVTIVGAVGAIAWWARRNAGGARADGALSGGDRSPATVRHAWLLIALASIAPLALTLAGLLGKDIMVTRYAAAAAPFLLTALAAACFVVPRPAAAVLGVAAAVAIVGGLVRSHDVGGRYPPAREAVEYIAADSRAGDWMFIPGTSAADIALGFYVERRLDPLPVFVESTDTAGTQTAFDSGGRIWIVRETNGPPLSEQELIDLSRPALEPHGYEPVKARSFTTSVTYYAVLAQPV